MKILIVGAGALGQSLADLLAKKAQVILWERNSAARLPKGTFIDVLIVATKIRDLKKAAASAAGLEPQYVFFPQNGIFDIDWAARLFKKAVIVRGVTTMACGRAGKGKTVLFYQGDIYAGGKGAQALAQFFRCCGLKSHACREVDGPVWSKLIFSAVMNPLPVITGGGYEVLRKDKEIWKLVWRAVKEGRLVARALKVRLAFDPMRLIKRVHNGDLAGIGHRGTIVQDIKAGRSTELDFITGALVRQARKAGIKTPALDLILRRARAAGA